MIISTWLVSWKTATTIGIRIPKVPQLVPVANARKQAIKKMITRNPLGRKVMKKLFVYAGSENPHMAQKPEFLDIASMNIKNKKRK